MRVTRGILAGVSACLLAATVAGPAAAATADGQARPAPIIVTEQAGDRVVVLDSTKRWANPNATLWSWQPGVDSDTGDTSTSWGLPDDARLRTGADGNQYVLVTDSYGLLASVPYPDKGPVAWSVDVGRSPNPHGIELLPDGNIAAAASNGSWIRVYTASQGRHSSTYVEAALPGAHEVWWDARLTVLWAIGDHLLVKYAVGGTPAAPTLTQLAAYNLPTNWGHDLGPVPADPDRLWLTTVYGVHQFQKSTGKFVGFPRQRELYASNIKSVGTDAATGTVLETTPKAGNPCSWCTDSVDLFVGADGTEEKVLPGAQIYRARWFDDESS
ncbi:hypothetical protein SAMN05421678_104138 [Actinopolymorpha cephalotaxi]|uniref:Uncharacterized protein n=1 Tax=Actinopolymorpha cephalotaxi TaxID=504797 RepID=A0A1I2PIZ6_9ACTN|nr:DUF6528 family protein [Actinopolymorpha cephalotaxi]NYH83610.1 hypothetical protein [Actinopolymorpha cephalotaxi]SFG15403.1 hypothetical protein SAMN05421678_104138 [Actinopolymorpha cephalotaxi]